MRKLIFTAVLSLFCLTVFAQAATDELPVDSMVRYGKLSNGLTYYIRHNAYPAKKADFYIAQKVGSIQENDHQLGLAHFLEHMAFNGSKNFPGRKTMIDYLEKQGARFGEDINAFTSFDETVYNLANIPVERTNVVDSCLLILHDWSGFLSLEGKQIDQERAIIKEEWRTRNNAQMRIWEKLFPVIYKGSKYAKRLPIGDMKIVQNFKYKTLRDYYHKWYRPDLQGIIVVGDINVDSVETKLKQMFRDIPKPVHPAKRVYYSVPDNKEPIVEITTDPEQTSTTIMMFVKHDVVPMKDRKTRKIYADNMETGLISAMLNERYSEISVKANSPFVGAQSEDGHYFVSKTKDAWATYAASKEGKVKETIARLLTENERVKRFGFTATELERAKKNVMDSYQNMYNNRNKTTTPTFTDEYVRSFTNDEPIPGMVYEYKLAKELLPQISLEKINNRIKELLTDKNRVIVIIGPEKSRKTYPSEVEIKNMLLAAKTEKVEPYKDKVVAGTLIPVLPPKGSITDTLHDSIFNSTVWKLSNGMKVVLKKTDFKDDQIVMSGSAYGGQSLADDANIFNARLAANVPSIGGLGAFSVNDLQKFLAGKTVSVSPSIGKWTVGMSGGSSKRDIETMLQLMYLNFTAPRKDKDAYASYWQNLKDELKNTQQNPMTALGDTVYSLVTDNNPRELRMHQADTVKVDYDKMISFYHQAFSNPGSFTFTFVGNIDPVKMKPLVEQYLASLPSGNINATYTKRKNTIRKGFFNKQFDHKMENPKTSFFSVFSGTVHRDLKNSLSMKMVEQLLQIMYTETVREKAGGTYGVSVSGSLARIPKDEALLQMNFDTDPKKIAVLAPLIKGEVAKLATVGPDDVKFEKVRKQLAESFADGQRMNGFWLSILSNYYFYHENEYSDYLKTLNSITKDDIKNLVHSLLLQNNYIEVIMGPKAK